jgi:cation transport ATPase
MGLSMVGMLIAAAGYLPPVAGAVAQELIDVAAVLNAVRVALPSDDLRDDGI